jgi:hypothetical protein
MKKALYIFLALACSITLFFIRHTYWGSPKGSLKVQNSPTQQVTPPKTVWVNVFVHGTFGTLLGILSLPNVLKDEVQGTAYRDINKNMRDDHYFFKTQPILDRGLLPVNPTFDLATTNHKLFAIYPITKAFDLFGNETSFKNYEQRYYAFGWSGLMSQHRRRFEAIRFFNALQEEISALKKQNLEPRIRLIAHSHGGNLCLNLGAIVPILNTKTFDSFHKYSLDPQTNESIKQMLTIITSLPTKELVAQAEGQKKFDYVPTDKNFSVDELILLGTPIQPETENFLQSPIFKTIYNIYSSEDTVQQADWVSTKNQTSKQRADEAFVMRANELARRQEAPRIIQIKIMYEHQVTESPEKALLVDSRKESSKPSLLDTLLGTRPMSKDPNHKELWCFHKYRTDRPKTGAYVSFLSPLPTAVMIPPILTLLDNNPALLDVDLNLTLTKKSLGFFLTKHNDQKVQDSLLLKTTLLDEIKSKVEPWYKEDVSPQKEFSTIYQHLTNHKKSDDKRLQEAT